MYWPLMNNSITWNDRIKLIKFLLKSDWYTNGVKVKEFENKWNEWLKSKYSLFVSSGSTANFLLIDSVKEYFKLNSRTKVLLPACTWPTNISPIFQLGLTPIFCDINFNNFSFNEEDLFQISRHHPDIKLIFVTHLLGYSTTHNILEEYFPEALIIDDCCECQRNLVGSNSLGATFSFYNSHFMSTIEGGMISTNNFALYDLMKMKRSHGMARNSDIYDLYAKKHQDIQKMFLFITHGYNFRNHELAAVLGLNQLKTVDKNIEIRNYNFKRFVNIINQYTWKFYPLSITENVSSFCLPFICRYKEVYDKLLIKLTEYGIEYRPIVGGNLLKQPFLNGYMISPLKNEYNVDILHNLGLYIGNSQFVQDHHLNTIEKIIREL